MTSQVTSYLHDFRESDLTFEPILNSEDGVKAQIGQYINDRELNELSENLCQKLIIFYLR